MTRVGAYRRPRLTAIEGIRAYEAMRLDPRASRQARETLRFVPFDLLDRVTWGIGFDEFGLDRKQMMYIDVRNFNNRVKPGVEAYVSFGSLHTASFYGMGTILEVKKREEGWELSRQNSMVLVDFDGVQNWVRGYQITAVVR